MMPLSQSNIWPSSHAAVVLYNVLMLWGPYCFVDLQTMSMYSLSFSSLRLSCMRYHYELNIYKQYHVKQLESQIIYMC